MGKCSLFPTALVCSIFHEKIPFHIHVEEGFFGRSITAFQTLFFLAYDE